MRVTTKRLRRLRGRDSTSTTVSPGFASLFSSCAMNFDVRRICLPYTSSRTCRSTATTTLLVILLLTTLPTISPLAMTSSCRLLAQDRSHSRQLAAQWADLVARLALAHRLLQAEPEHLFLEIARALRELVSVEPAQIRQLFRRLHDTCSPPNCVVKRTFIGSFADARRIASRASVAETPSISNRIRPGLMTATHPSGAPLPLPIRVSCGFLVTGL